MLKLVRRLIETPPLKVRLPAALVGKASDEASDTPLRAVGRSRAQIAPAVLLATGAGVAFWWWAQWARGRTEDGPEKKP